MYKQIAKITFVTFIWKKYKHLIVSTLCLFAYLYLIGNVHQDYLSYLKLEQNGSGTGMSFIIKWFAMISGVGLYIAYNLFNGKSQNNPKEAKAKKKPAKNSKYKNDPDENDPFEDLRHTKPLRSKADIVIEQNLKNKK
jgi:hypothetical protein